MKSNQICACLPVGRKSIFKIKGHSMHPILKDGDEVEIQKANEYKIGDVIAFHHPFRKIIAVKKIINLNTNSVEVKGVNIESEDAIGAVPKKSIIGIVK